MRTLFAALSFMILAATAACTPSGDDVASVEAIDNAVGELDGAFEAQDAAAVKALMTTDHVAVTPYGGSQSVAEVIDSLPDFKIKQTDLSEPTVQLLGPGAAMRTLTAKLDGTFKGEPFSDQVFVTSILVKRDGKWLERFYQVTRIGP